MSESDSTTSGMGHPAEGEAPHHALESAEPSHDAALEDSDAYALAVEDGEGLSPPLGAAPEGGFPGGAGDGLDVVFREPGA
jgi:hypothetical protein